MHGVTNLALLGILLLNKVVSNISAEETIVSQHRLRHTAAQRRVYVAHKYRRSAERLGHPTGKAGVFSAKLIVHPQMPAPGQSVVTAAKERTVGLSSQSGFKLEFGILQMLVVSFIGILLIVCKLNLFKSGKELLVLGQILCH